MLNPNGRVSPMEFSIIEPSRNESGNGTFYINDGDGNSMVSYQDVPE
jgi:hypothetical protein